MFYQSGEIRVIFSSTNTMNQCLLMKRKAVCSEHPMQIDSSELHLNVFREIERDHGNL